MDIRDAVKKFESILKCHNEKSLNLYNQQENNNNCYIKPKEVISNLRQQLNTLQKADATNNVGQPKRLINFKKSNMQSFVSVNMLTDDSEVSSNQPINSTFETQFVTDTQLLSLVEDAELQLEQGMTQEFSTSFIKSETNDEEVSKIDFNNDRVMSNFEKQIEMSELTCNASTRSIKESEINVSYDTNTEKLNTSDNINFYKVKNHKINEFNTSSNDIPNIENINNCDDDLDIPLSPVLKCSILKSKEKSNLIYNLESFEKFESIAVPIVEENTDKRTATKIINSQMVDRVLFLNLHTQPTLLERDKQSSPVINFADEELVITKDVCGRITPDKRSDSLKDDILVSSDEDEDYIHNVTPELPIAFDSSSDETDDLDKSMYVGFQTASNKSIQVNSEAFQKAKRVLSDLETNENFYLTNNNNSIEIKNNSIEKTLSKRKFNSLETTNNKKKKKSEVIYEDIHCKKDQNNMNYKTDEVNLSKIIDDDLIQEFDNVEMSQNHNKSTKLFKITNKNIELENIIERSKSKMDFSKKSLKDFERHENLRDTLSNCSIRSLYGFKTASNKDVQVSSAALAKSNAIFQDINIDGCNSALENSNKSKSSTRFIGFQTASNKDVKISTEALEKSRKIFENITDLSFAQPKIAETPLFKGFKTASNKEIKISQQALEKYETILKEIDIFDNEVINNQVLSNKSTKASEISVNKNNANERYVFKGFRTASNREVKVSETSLAQSKKILNDIDLFNTDISNLPTNNQAKKIYEVKKDSSIKDIVDDLHDKQFVGFKTASRKNVVISKEALEKSKMLFKDIDLDSNTANLNKPLQTETFQGFQTASHKKVNVSAQALQKTKDIFQDFDFSQKILEPKSEYFKEFKGFQTASCKNVSVSKEALKKSKKLFEDLNTTNYKNDFDFKTKHSSYTVVPEPVKTMTNYSNNIYIKPSGDKQFNEMNKKQEKSVNTGFKTGNTRTARILQEALNKTYVVLEHNQSTSNNERLSDIEGIINTQVIKNFDEELCTEDLTSPRSKRSGSPILSCPSAKRRKKFKTPYRNKVKFKPKIHNTVKPPCDDNYKKNKKYNLKDIYEMETQSKELAKKIDLKIYDFDNLLKFQFAGDRNDLNRTNLTAADIVPILEDSLDKKIIPKGWTQNHIKLILWKLLSYEIKFPKVMQNVCTAKNVLEQLKFRYFKELYNSERSALRKILEKDETSLKTMVLCVVAVHIDAVKVNSVQPPNNNIELLLTDGWYSIMATLDKMLIDLVVKNKIQVGTKLAVSGADLVNCEQGIAPWENTSAVRLKLFGNSTRRARWNARLGFHGNGAILSQLSSVKPDGGKVSKTRAFVTRVYPMLYVEKFEDGSTVTRSERLENLHQIKFENERQTLMEKIYEDVEKEFADQMESQESQPALGDKLESGSQIARAMKKCNDPAEFKSNLTHTQLRQLEDHTNRHREEYLQKVQARLAVKLAEEEAVNRRVTSMVKMRVAGVTEKDGVIDCRSAMLTIWRPNETVLEIVKEGSWIEMINVVPTAVRYSELQISAGRQSIFRESNHKQTNAIKKYTDTLKRQCCNIKKIIHHDSDEIDTLGMVFLIEPTIKQFDSTKQSFQNVYLTDEDKNFICVNFWGGIKKFGYENLLHIGDIVVCLNLQKRAGNTRKNIPQFRVTELTYFTKTPKDSVARNMADDMEKKCFGVDRLKFCEECKVLKNNVISIRNYNADISPYIFNNSDFNNSKNKMFIDSPLTTKTKIDDNLNLTGLDFESTFRQTNTQDLSPNTLARKKKVQERIDKLKKYGEPPPITSISIMNQSKNAAKAYKSPLPNSNSPTIANLNENLPIDSPLTRPSSPIIAIGKKYVIKNINPVKLNFSNNVAINDSIIEEFAEDFESSPPLSLD